MPGTSTSIKRENKIVNKKSPDALDVIIFDKGVRIHNLYIDFDYKLMIVLLNTGKAFKFSFKKFPRLNEANQSELNDFRLISNGIGVHWNMLDEDISLKGIIKQAVELETLKRLQSKDTSELAFF